MKDTQTDRRQLYRDFQKEFPLETLKDMPLKRYTNLNKEDSFCYWIESRTYELGSYWGGSSYKFGIYKYRKKPNDARIQTDDEYAWYTKYNAETADEAYAIVLDAVQKVAKCAYHGDFDAIEELNDLGESFKWKIAFLYSNEKLIPIYKRQMLETLVSHWGGVEVQKMKTSELQQFLFAQKGEHDLYTFYDELLAILQTEGTKPKYWIYAPGEGATRWEWCLKHQQICIGWDDLGDLNEYKSRKAITKKLQEFYEDPENSFKNDSLALWEFSHEMKPGDVVFAKNGIYHLIGRGVVESDYCFDNDLDCYNHVRKIKWTHSGDWAMKEKLPMKTLTDITKYEGYAQTLESLISGDKPQPHVSDKLPTHDEAEPRYWWLVANPKMWSMLSLEVGKTIDYELYSDTGAKRKVFQNFLDAKEGDIVIGYEATPVKQIVALAEVSRANDGKTLQFRKKEDLLNPIPYAEVKILPELKDMQFFVNPLGSLFALTREEYEVLMEVIRNVNPVRVEEKKEKYDREDFLKEVFVGQTDYDKLSQLLIHKKNVILQGAPGVGKTFSAKRLAYAMMGEKDDNRIECVQFHQNYCYEDFVMGYRPNEDGGFELKRGIFYNFCVRAANDRKNKYFFVIDEINRGNLSKILGELMMLIEKDYRETRIKLAYSSDYFFVPSNVYIIGMMNTADRSLAMIDYALRRRFSFFDMRPGFKTPGFVAYQKKLDSQLFDEAIEAIERLNEVIKNDSTLGEGFCIGHSYFCNQYVFDSGWLETVIAYDIIPMLKEYWFDQPSRYDEEAEKLMKILK